MPRPLLSTASRRLQSTAASVKRRPIPAPTPLALDSFDAVFRASRVASIQPELAGEQVLAIPEPRNDAEWEGWDKRKERGDFGLKAELGPASGKGCVGSLAGWLFFRILIGFLHC